MRHTPGSVAAPAASCKTCRRASFILWPRHALESRALREQRPASTRSIEKADGLRWYRRKVWCVLQRNLACRAEDNWSYDKWSYDVRGRGSAVIGYGRGRSAFCGPRGVRCGSRTAAAVTNRRVRFAPNRDQFDVGDKRRFGPITAQPSVQGKQFY